MDTDILKVTSQPLDEQVVIPDECGDSLWDRVLEQSVLVEAVQLVSKAGPVEVKDTEVKK